MHVFVAHAFTGWLLGVASWLSAGLCHKKTGRRSLESACPFLFNVSLMICQLAAALSLLKDVAVFLVLLPEPVGGIPLVHKNFGLEVFLLGVKI
jgi:hypothetical protein